METYDEECRAAVTDDDKDEMEAERRWDDEKASLAVGLVAVKEAWGTIV